VEAPEVRYARGGEVNIAFQVAGPGELLVSGTVTELVAGSELRFRERDPGRLKGIPGERRLYALIPM
jgi:class 3 adenylate cyclase